MSAKSRIQYACAVLLICSSIALAFISDFVHGDIPSGTLMYIAQAFLLAGSIFGLEYYLTKLNTFLHEKDFNADAGDHVPAEHSCTALCT